MAIRYTKQQKASPYFDAYKKERARLQRFATSAKARGIELPKDFVPKVPQKITAGSVRKLQRITPEHGYYEKATFRGINRFTGEVIESKRGSATSINRAIARYKESIREALEPTEPLSKRRIQQITESFSEPDVFSTARHKSMLRQVEKRNTPQELEDTLKKIEKKEQETEEIPEPYIGQDSTVTDEEESYSDYWKSLTPEQRELEYRGFERDEARQRRLEELEAEEPEPAIIQDSTLTDEDLPEPAIGQDSTFTEYEPDYSETDSDFDTAFNSDYRYEIDRINWQRQLDIVNSYIDNAVTYIGEHVSGHMADAVAEMISQFRSTVSDKDWAELMYDENFWDDIASTVEEYYKTKKDPMPEVYNRISSRLAGRPMTMEENSRYEQYAEEQDSDSYDY